MFCFGKKNSLMLKVFTFIFLYKKKRLYIYGLLRGCVFFYN